MAASLSKLQTDTQFVTVAETWNPSDEIGTASSNDAGRRLMGHMARRTGAVPARRTECEDTGGGSVK